MISLGSRSFIQKSHFQAILAFSVFALWSLILTWPLANSIATHIPLGSEVASTVPFLNLWTMEWNANRVSQGFQSYWNAPIFYPVEGSFAFADPQPFTGLLSASISSLSPALAYNLVLILFLSLNGWSVFRLLISIDTPFIPALFSGFLAQTLPFITHERGVLQLQPLFGMIWALGSFWHLIHKSSWRNAVGLGLAITITFLTSEYYGLFLVLILLPLGIYGISHQNRWRFLQRLLVTGIIAALLSLPTLLTQQSILNEAGFHRDLSTITHNSASLADYANAPEQTFGGSISSSLKPSRQPLFPGFGVIALGSIGLVAGLQNRQTRPWSFYLLIAMGAAFLVSFGPHLRFGNWQPYLLLRSNFPGFENLRSPYRLAVWVQIALVLLASINLTKLWQRNSRWLMIGLTAVALLELMPVEMKLTTVPGPLPLTINQGATLSLPYVHGSSAAVYEETATWMLQTLPLDVQLVNGYSGYFPAQNREFKTLFEDFPTDAAIAKLRELDVQNVIIRSSWLTAHQSAEIAILVDRELLTLVQETSTYQVYVLSNYP